MTAGQSVTWMPLPIVAIFASASDLFLSVRVPPGREGPAPGDLRIRIVALSGGWGDRADVHQGGDEGSRQWDDAHSLTYPPAPGKGLDCPRISATMGI